MNTAFDTRVLHHVGRISVTVQRYWDEDGDAFYLGEYTDSYCVVPGQWLYHRGTGSISKDGTIWRDERGRIVTEPNTGYNGREYKFILLGNGQSCIKEALRDARRLEALGRGDWSFVGIVATVRLDGAEIGRSSTWGFESDARETYLQSEERSIAHEALTQARDWLDSNTCQSR